MLENFRGLRKFARDRNCRKCGTFSRQARQVRKAPQPRPEVNFIFDMAVFATFARDNPNVWLRLCRAGLFVSSFEN
jgi:hypothetical protein